MQEARCLVCGDPLGDLSWFTTNDVRVSEVCSDECFDVYTNEDEE